MNERIKLLAEQAEGTKKHVPAVWQFYDHELEKFAELIAKECANVAFNDWCEGTNEESSQMAILKHFGVEE